MAKNNLAGYSESTAPPKPPAWERIKRDPKQEAAARLEADREARQAQALVPALAMLAVELGTARELLASRTRSKPERAELAASQIETLLDQRRAVTAALLTGEIDPQTAGTASKSITECVSDLRWFAERIDSENWGAKQTVDLNMKVSVETLSQRLIEGRARVLPAVPVLDIIPDQLT